jgi:hypothetical protein
LLTLVSVPQVEPIKGKLSAKMGHWQQVNRAVQQQRQTIF